ncbi:MAG TPA: redoxin domain-containing protein [Planctomycetaceae bacterium]|nr:redoxin domain-containing protein [Planctomycetaceae bacterium]
MAVVFGALLGSLSATGELSAQQKPEAKFKPEDLFKSFLPKQRDVEIETPPPAEFAKCKVEVESRGKASGYVVLGPAGQVLRRFTDTDGDGNVDQWRYYNQGVEVYRDLDSEGKNRLDKKPRIDQSRWLNLGGSRWGVYVDDDNRIDRWLSLSAAEASREAVEALVAGDAAALQTLMITAADLRQLGVNSQLAAKILESTSDVSGRMKAVLAKSKVVTPKTKWIRFDVQMPGVIPADDGKATEDLHVYENAMVMVEPGPSMVQIGEMVRVGDVWKLTQVPMPIEGTETTIASGFLMQPVVTNAGSGDIEAPSPAMQKLIEDLQKLDQNQPQLGAASKDALATYNARRADLLLKLMSLAGSEEEKAQFLKQCVDGLAAAVQTDAYPDGLAKIKQLEAGVEKSSPKSPVLPYIIYRRIMSDYSVDMKVEDAEKRATVQKDWLAALTDFVAKYPQADDLADAMLQLAVAKEFGGEMKEATDWYRQLAQKKPGSPAADKAAGAIRRLDMKGKPFALTGAGLTKPAVNTAAYRGKVLLVFYWATWCQPCKEDLPALRAMYQQHRSQGFEVVGVCLDIPNGTRQQQVAEISQFLTANKVPWEQIFEPGGLDNSPPAVQYGIISLPTMFLIDQRGEVVSRNSSVDELKTVLPQLLDPKAGLPKAAPKAASKVP